MAIQSKYIIVDEHGLEVPIVFNPILNHKEIAGYKKVISAGFCKLNVYDLDEEGHIIEGCANWSVWGESNSLKIKSRPEDAEILNKLLSIDF